MTYTPEVLRNFLKLKLDDKTRSVIEGMLADAREPEDVLADHESAVVEELIHQTGGADLARFKIKTLIDRMVENGFDDPSVADDYRDLRLAQSALRDLIMN